MDLSFLCTNRSVRNFWHRFSLLAVSIPIHSKLPHNEREMSMIISNQVPFSALSPWTTFIVVANDLRGEVLCAVLLMMIFTLDSRAQWTARKAWGRLFGRKKIGFEGLEVSDPLTGSTPSIA